MQNNKYTNCFTIDVEDWYHILDSPETQPIEHWGKMESRVANNVERMLALLAEYNVRATFFWLGWVAQNHKDLLLRCHQSGHEIASHGYGHVLPYKVGPKHFREDIVKGKQVLEDIIGEPVIGFRAPGFGITRNSLWAFKIIKQVGFKYDSSVFPAARGHGGMKDSALGVHAIDTQIGPLVEVPMSVIKVFNNKVPLFGGGYLRLAPVKLIHFGVRQLHKQGQPLVVYIHPREIDPSHPRLPLSLLRRIKSYVNLKSTMPKLESLLRIYDYVTMRDMVSSFIEDGSYD